MKCIVVCLFVCLFVCVCVCVCVRARAYVRVCVRAFGRVCQDDLHKRQVVRSPAQKFDMLKSRKNVWPLCSRWNVSISVRSTGE